MLRFKSEGLDMPGCSYNHSFVYSIFEDLSGANGNGIRVARMKKNKLTLEFHNSFNDHLQLVNFLLFFFW
jgi:hypothetical protein